MSEEIAVRNPGTMFQLANSYYTSLDKDKMEHKRLIMECLNNCDERIKQVVNAQIDVANIFAHVVEITDPDGGEIRQCPRCVLITPDNTTYQCVSEGVYRDLSTLIWLYGHPPWNPPIKVVPKLIDLQGGRNMLKLHLVDENKPSKKAVKS